MRIGLLAYDYPLEQGGGGIGTYSRVLALTLKQLGHSPFVVLTGATGPRQEEVEGIPLHRVAVSGAAKQFPFPIGRGASLMFAWELANLARELRLDIFEAPEFVGMTAFFDWFKPGKLTSIVRLHTGYGVTREIAEHLLRTRRDRFARRGLMWAERRVIMRANSVSAVSRALVKETCRSLGIPRSDFEIIPCPVDQSFFEPVCGISEEPGLVLLPGRVEWRKGVDRLFRVIPQVIAGFPQARFVFAGADTDSAPTGGSMKEWLLKDASQQVKMRVEFLGHVPQRRMRELYHQASVCILPSRWEGYPIAVQEALACGKAVILSDIAPMREVVDEGRTGLVVDADDESAFAAAILRLLRDPETRKRLGDAGQAQAQAQYHPRTVTEKMLEFYRRAQMVHLS